MLFPINPFLVPLAERHSFRMSEPRRYKDPFALGSDASLLQYTIDRHDDVPV
jgi:hypothetical protein